MRTFALAFASLCLAAACVDTSGGPATTPADTGPTRHYRQTGWLLPSQLRDVGELGVDVDKDANHTLDNALGLVIAMIAEKDVDFQSASDAAFDTGQVVLRHSLRADDLQRDATITWIVYDGAGAEVGRFIGEVTAGRVVAEGENVTVPLPLFPGAPILDLPLVRARVEVDATDTTCVGRLGGAMREADVTATLLPAWSAQLADYMAAHPEAAITSDAMPLYDANGDGAMTADEIRDNAFTQALFQPDLDLDGDGVKDATSVSLGFACEPADFVAAE